MSEQRSQASNLLVLLLWAEGTYYTLTACGRYSIKITISPGWRQETPDH